jgi:hypothetical protein
VRTVKIKIKIMQKKEEAKLSKESVDQVVTKLLDLKGYTQSPAKSLAP